ncbi:MAG: lysophospholipase [Cyanobacteria bacterium P01_G01_bin.39]
MPGTFLGANGLELYYQSWHPQAAAKAVLIIVHGHGAHSDIFTNVVEYLVEQDYTIYSFDLRGHGRSPGKRGYINSWDEYRLDLDAFVKLTQAQEPELPLFLAGQSMGGTIVLDYVLRTTQAPPFEGGVASLRTSPQLAGLVLISPALGLSVAPWKLLIGQLLSSVWPRFTLSAGIDFATASRDPKVIAANSQDPLRHGQGTARLARELLKTIDWVRANGNKLPVPLLMLHGEADRVTLFASSQIFFEGLTLADKEMPKYPDSYHELHNDLNYREVLADLKDWLERHLEPD